MSRVRACVCVCYVVVRFILDDSALYLSDKCETDTVDLRRGKQWCSYWKMCCFYLQRVRLLLLSVGFGCLFNLASEFLHLRLYSVRSSQSATTSEKFL